MIRKNIGFTDFGDMYLKKEMERYNSSSATDTIDKIFKEHQELTQLIIDRNSLVEQIYDRFKKDISTILARTGHTVKNTNVAMELWNGFLFANNQSEYVTTDEFVSTPLKKATEKVNNEIAGLRQKKLEKK